MFLFKKIPALQQYLDTQRHEGRSIGFVPTMGALHEGHLSLIRRSLEHDDLTLCSIFVNPTQFNDPDDLEKYPVTIESDIEKLAGAGNQVLFLPDRQEVYPEKEDNVKSYDLGKLGDVLEGRHRPGHFQGVAQVVERLLEIVKPDRLYLGQKDYQQYLIINRLIRTLDLPVETVLCPIVREADGLAMSSRNRRLHPDARKDAAQIFATLTYASDQITVKEPDSIRTECIDRLLQLRSVEEVEYFDFADTEELQEIKDAPAGRDMVICVSAKLGGVRLIDNVLIN